MTGQFPETFFKDAVDFLLTETFTEVRGAYLDRGTSLFETLATIDAAEASKPISPCCGSIAAQVYHTRFYIDVSEQYMNGTPPENVDWDGSWTAVTTVNDEEWQSLIGDLRASVDRVRADGRRVRQLGRARPGQRRADDPDALRLSPRADPPIALHDQNLYALATLAFIVSA